MAAISPAADVPGLRSRFMSRRSRLVVVLLAVVSMSGGATSGVYLGRLEDGRKLAATRPPPTRNVPRYWIQPTQSGGGQGAPQPGGQDARPADGGGQATTRPGGQAAPPTSSGLAFIPETTVVPAVPTTVPGAATTTAGSPGATTSTTGPLVLTARIDARLPDGLLIRLDASEPLQRVVLRWGAPKQLAHTTPIQGTVTHGSVKLPLKGKGAVTVEASGRTADGRTVTSNQVTGQPS
jgi:hypothetical protein